MAQKLKRHAEKRGTTPGSSPSPWVLNNGLFRRDRRPAHAGAVEDYLGALKHRFTAEDEALVDELVPRGHASTHGYNDPRYPVEGRRARIAR